jgi:hypothetical protein
MNTFKYIFAFGALLVAAACSNIVDLERPPLDQIGNDSYWRSAGDLEKYVLQFYPAFIAEGRTGMSSYDATQGSDIMIDATVNRMLDGTRPVPTNSTNDVWNWSDIRSVNIFFENYKRSEDDFELYRHYLGEAHFFKAYFYFEKVDEFGNVPWYTRPLQTNSEELYKARDARTVVVDSILWHLDQAIELMDPLAEVDGGNNRLSREAALLFKSRVALFEGTWQKYHAGTVFGTAGANAGKYFQEAVNAAEELIDGDYSVETYNTGSPEADYYNLFGMDDYSGNPEVILWQDFDRSLDLSHNSELYLTARTDNKAVTLSMVSAYLAKDGNYYDYEALINTDKGNAFLEKLAADVDPRLAQSLWIPGDLMWDNNNGIRYFDKPFVDKTSEARNSTGFQLKKGSNPHSPGAGAGFGGDSETGFIVFRYAEALLNYAEAKYELDQNVDYDKSINLLRARVGMPDFAIPGGTEVMPADYGYPISSELHEIRRERAVELAFEGHRNRDLRRWAAHELFQGQRPKGYPLDPDEWQSQQILIPTDENGLLDPMQLDLGADGYGFREDRDYLNGVPINEITLNPNLQQNPGWSQ